MGAWRQFPAPTGDIAFSFNVSIYFTSLKNDLCTNFTSVAWHPGKEPS